MHFLTTTTAVLSLSASVLATSTHNPSSNIKRHAHLKRGSGYSLTTHAAGQDFFDLFNFESHQTGSNAGLANCSYDSSCPHVVSDAKIASYVHKNTDVDQETAWAKELVAVKHGKAHIRVSPESNGDTLDAVRLVSKQRYTEGLYVWDVERMPRTFDPLSLDPFLACIVATKKLTERRFPLSFFFPWLFTSNKQRFAVHG